MSVDYSNAVSRVSPRSSRRFRWTKSRLLDGDRWALFVCVLGILLGAVDGWLF